MVPWVVPPAEEVTSLVPPNAGTTPKQEDLAALSQRCDDGDVVITAAVATNDKHLDITVSRYAADGSVTTDTTSVESPRPGAALYRAGVAAAVVLLENQWKAVTLPGTASASPTSIEVDVPISQPAEWGTIRSRLAKVGAVQGLTIEILTRHDARLTLNVDGDDATVQTALAQQDLILGPTSGPVRSLTLRTGVAAQ
jgi:hypothetical protein